MKGRRASLVVILLAAGGAVWLIGGGPRTTTVVYDLGPEAPETVRFTARFHDGSDVIRATTWRFRPDMAPAQVEQEVAHPRRALTVLLTVETADGVRTERRPFDGAAGSDRVVLHVAP